MGFFDKFKRGKDDGLKAFTIGVEISFGEGKEPIYSELPIMALDLQDAIDIITQRLRDNAGYGEFIETIKTKDVSYKYR